MSLKAAAGSSNGARMPRLVVVGSGWGAATLVQQLDLDRLKAIVISPSTTKTYTPLLASAATGLFGFRVTEEPIRTRSRSALHFYKAKVTSVDWKKKRVICEPAFDEGSDVIQTTAKDPFEVDYDFLALSPGCQAQTFGIEGVAEHALMMRSAEDARILHHRIENVCEMAALPSTTPERRKELLHFAVVGGGPTGIEIAAEMWDLVHYNLVPLYPFDKSEYSITIYDVAPQILGMFDKDLAEYSRRSFEKRGVKVATSTTIKKASATHLTTEEEGDIGYGVLVWATGNGPIPLTEKLKCKKTEEGRTRIQTNRSLQVLDEDGNPMDDVYALGDAADIIDMSLPETAEVATQKGKHLATFFNSRMPTSQPPPFQYSEGSMMANIGGGDGVQKGEDGGNKQSGRLAYLKWRYGTLTWSSTWRMRVLILVNFCLNFVFGRDFGH